MRSLTWHRADARRLADDPALHAQWDALNARPPQLPFLSAQAVVAALDVFGCGSEQLLWAEQSGRPAFMAVLVPQGRLRWSTFQPSQVPLGTWVSEPGVPLQTWANGLLRSGPLGWALALSFTQVDPLCCPPQADDARNCHEDYAPTAWLDIQGSFEDYWALRGKNLRQNMRKQRTKLAADGMQTHMRVWRSEADVAPALARYGAMESLGWKAGQGTAIHPDNDQGRFYIRLLGEAARHGQTLITEYLFNDRTVAMNLGLIRGGTWIVLKTTYDESLGKTVSPSSLLREEELQSAFAGTLGVNRIEYYGRVMDWHTKLTEQQRTLYHLSTYRWPWVKRVALRRRAQQQPTSAEAATVEVLP